MIRTLKIDDGSATAEQIKEEDLLREQMGTQSLQVRFDEVEGCTHVVRDT